MKVPISADTLLMLHERSLREHGGDPASDAALVRSLRARLQVSNPRFALDADTGEDEWT